MTSRSREHAFGPGWQAAEAIKHMPPALAEKTRKQRALVDCSTCGDDECRHRQRDSRLPVDAGGEAQCLRLAKAESAYCWRDGRGNVVVIPEDVVAAIRGK